MVRRRSVLSSIAALLATACGPCEVRRIVVDASRVPSACDVHEVGPARHVTQTFAAPEESIAGVEIFASRYPGLHPLDLMITITDEERELAAQRVAIPDRLPMPVRVVFPGTHARGSVTIEAWAPDARPGSAAAIQFVPIDCYSGGNMGVAGRPVRGDLAFRVLARDTSTTCVVTGVDMAGIRGRFPSENLAEAGELRQQFLATRDSLTGVEFITATGGHETGAPLGWAVEVDGVVVRHGKIERVRDNAVERVEFEPVYGVRDRGCTVRLWALEPGEVRVWLCQGTSEMKGLSVRENRVGGALVMTALHLAERSDSMRVVISVEGAPSPEPAGFLLGECRMRQTVSWPGAGPRPNLIGFRLASAGGIITGHLTLEIDDGRGVAYRDTIAIAGEGSDDFVWMRLPAMGAQPHAAVTVGGVGARTETAARFWWMPADLHRGGEATGCVPKPGGDCVFRLAKGYTSGAWLLASPELLGEPASDTGGGRFTMLLILRALLLPAAVTAAVCVGRRARCPS